MDFTSRQSELIALAGGLSRSPQWVGERISGRNGLASEFTEARTRCLSPGRIFGVIDLLKRVICLAAETHGERITVLAQVPYLAARMQGFRCVNERTVRNWIEDARALGVLDVEFRSHGYGSRNWNCFVVRRDRLAALVLGGSGRKWAATDAALGAATDAAPQIREVFGNDISPDRAGCAGPGFVNLPEANPGSGASPGSRTYSVGGCLVYSARPIRVSPIDGPLPEWPELEGLDTPVEPHPEGARELSTRGVWKCLNLTILANTVAMIEWHQRQLSLPQPVCGTTAAHRAFVIAAAIRVSKLSECEVRTNRCAIFVGIIRHQKWEIVRPFLPLALERIANAELVSTQ